MKKGLKYALVGLGSMVKLWGFPLEAHCPTNENSFYQKESPEIYSETKTNYDGVNLKKPENFYNICEER